MNVLKVEHPVVKSIVTKLRDKNTNPEGFRASFKRIVPHLLYESLKDIKTTGKEVQTFTNSTYEGDAFAHKIGFVAVLRAGLSMIIDAMEAFPEAEFHTIGLRRNEEDPFNGEPEFYLDRLDEIGAGVKTLIITDPMLATGGTLISILDSIKRNNYQGEVKIVCLIASEVGIKKVLDKHPNVQIVCAGVDKELNEKGFIVPGLGDAGDRFFGVNLSSL